MNFQRRDLLLGFSAAFAGFFLSKVIDTAYSQSSHPNNNKPSQNTINTQKVADRAEIIDAVNMIGMCADLRDWKACRAAFADKVLTDYTSLTGGSPSTVEADKLVAGWTEVFSKNFKSTQHMITNHAVEIKDDKATCASLFQAHHVYLDNAKGKTWTLRGYYNHGLTRINGRWKVTEMKMTWTWEDGARPS
jgi:hypothetical protein